MTVLFRFLAGFIVYLILGLVTILCIAMTAFSWYRWMPVKIL